MGRLPTEPGGEVPARGGPPTRRGSGTVEVASGHTPDELVEPSPAERERRATRVRRITYLNVFPGQPHLDAITILDTAGGFAPRAS